MNKLNKALLFILIVITPFIQIIGQNSPQHSKKVVGYYAQWAIFARDYNVLDIEGDKLTHIMYAFFNPVYNAADDTASIESLDSYADFDHNESGLHAWDATVKGNIGDLKILKENFPHLKVLISVGGWTKSQDFPAIAESSNAREALAQSMVDFMNLYPWIDGFDLDWEFPVIGGTDGNESINGVVIPTQPHTPNDHKNFVYLLKEIRETFDANNMQEKEVSISMGNNVINAASQFIGPGNEIANGMTENIMDFCDFVTFFGYDFGGNWYDTTCYNAPLYGGDNVNDPLYNPNGRNQVLDELVDVYLTDVGIPADKLIMGLPFYGKLFEGVAATGVDPNNPGLYESAPRVNSSCSLPQPPQGTWDAVTCESSGSIEFCDLSQGIGSNIHNYLDPNNPLNISATAASNGWVRYWDDIAKVPYLYNATQSKFISYDDSESIDLKVKYTTVKQLGGVMIWELSQDARNSDLGLLDVVDTALQEVTYDITLNFKEPDLSPIEGVVVELKDQDDAVIETLTSNSSGQVIFEDKDAFLIYTISYAYNDYAFLPSTIHFDSLEFDSDKEITITGSDQVYTIQGNVRENGQLLPNIDVILSNDSGEELERITTPDGNFVFNSVIGSIDYTITSDEEFYSFNTLTYIDLSANQSNEELMAVRDMYAITGNVSTGGNPIEGVTITVNGNNQTYTEITDTNGDYIFNSIPAGYNYVITPSLSTMTFNPSSTNVSNFNSDAIADFEENLGLIYGTVKTGSIPVDGAVVNLTLPWTDSTHGYQNITKTTNSVGEYFYTESELNGYNTITSLKLNAWENNSVIYYPTDLSNIAITSSPQEFNFNSEPVIPEITINTPNQLVLNETYGTAIDLEALVELSYDDGTTNLSSVMFTIDDVIISNSSNLDIYTGSWSPSDSDYGFMHTFTVIAEASNGENATEIFDFTLNCIGTNCPNIAPEIVWNLPNNTTINQNEGFENIPIQVTAIDSDGTITSVTITIDGNTTNMISGVNDTYTHSFTPTNHQAYPIEIITTDNENESTTYTTTLNIINSQFVPLPSEHIILGYAHSWENAGAPFLYFNEMLTTNYNVVMYSFIETVGQNGYSPQLTINSNRYQTNGSFDSQLLKDDINSLRSQGIPVIVSIGGQNGHVELNTIEEKDEFVQGLKDIVDEYGFDGIDLDFEGGSMNFEAGALNDFSYSGISAYPKLKNVVDAFKEIKQYYGSNFILTCAPETFYVQVGHSTYASTAGAFLPVIHNLRDELDLIMVQLYNTGSIVALDGQAYSQATPDFLTSMSDMLITGFDVASTGFHFNGFPASKIMVGIPSCPSAAPAGGYIEPTEVKEALDYLRFGADFSGRSYDLQGSSHENLRGVMTWSVNWDAASGCASEYEFSDSYHDYFNPTVLSINDNINSENITIYPNPVLNILTIKTLEKITYVKLYDMLGKEVYSNFNVSDNINLNTLNSGLYFIELKIKTKIFYKKIIKI